MIIGVVANRSKSATPEATGRLLEVLRNRGVRELVDQDLAGCISFAGDYRTASIDEIREQAGAVAVFGGDGTMLATGRRFAGSNVPLIGFNLGRLGFLAEFAVDEMESTLDALLQGRMNVVERTLIEAEIDGDGAELVGMNDIVIDKRETRLLVKLEVLVNGDYLGTYSADGLIVATPTGSTAYALAVGGPVVAPNAGVLVLAPIAPHMLTARPVVLSDAVELTITPVVDHGEPQEVRIIADGQESRHIASPRTITIRKYPHTVHLVKSPERTYFDVLRAKLLWGRRPSLREGREEEEDL